MANSTWTETKPKKQGFSTTLNGNERYDTFTLFPKLPTELRLQIWRHAAFVTRNLALSKRKLGYVEIDPVWRDYILATSAYHSKTRPPPVLHTNKESRTEALKWYSLGFGVVYQHRDFTFSTPPRIYINWKTDRVCLQNASKSFGGQDFGVEDFRNQCTSNNLRFMALNLCNASATTLKLWPASLEELVFFDQLSLNGNRSGGRFDDFHDVLQVKPEVKEYEKRTRSKKLSWDRQYNEWRERRDKMNGYIDEAWGWQHQPGKGYATTRQELRVQYIRPNFSKERTS